MEVQIIEKYDEFRQLEPYWNDLLQESSSNTIFLTFEWLDAYLKTIARYEKLAIVVAREGDRPLAIAPLMLQKREGFTILCSIGHEGQDYEDFLVHPCRQNEALNALFQTIMKMKSWSLFQLNRVREDSQNFEALRLVAENHGAVTRVYSVAPYLRVVGEFESYWDSLKRTFRANVRRRHKKLANEAGEPVYAVAQEPADRHRLFDSLVDMHIERRRHIKGDYSFLENAERRAFCRTLVEAMARKGALHLSHLSLDGKPLAIHLGFKYNRRFYYYLPTFDARYEQYAVGHSLIKNLLQECFGDSCDEFDFLLGNESYKWEYNPLQRHLHSFSFYPRSFNGTLSRLWWSAGRELLRKNPLMQRALPLLYRAGVLKTNT